MSQFEKQLRDSLAFIKSRLAHHIEMGNAEAIAEIEDVVRMYYVFITDETKA